VSETHFQFFTIAYLLDIEYTYYKIYPHFQFFTIASSVLSRSCSSALANFQFFTIAS